MDQLAGLGIIMLVTWAILNWELTVDAAKTLGWIAVLSIIIPAVLLGVLTLLGKVLAQVLG